MKSNDLSEKVSVNVNSSTLSSIDILVDNGYYSNRSDFINQALRESLQKHQGTLDRIIAKHETEKSKSFSPWFIGVSSLGNAYLEELKAYEKRFTFSGYGVLVIDKDVDEEMLFSVIEKINVKGRVISSQSIKEHYKLK